MRILFTINKEITEDPNQSIIKRQASRAIIFKGNELLMIQSDKYGEYKFPGGGVHSDETPIDAMKREVREETGLLEILDIQEFGKVIELRKAIDPGIDVFLMESFYYMITVGSMQIKQQLDPYEQDYGYQVKLVRIEDAIETNKLLFGNTKVPWVERETAVLELLQQNIGAN
jgi:8-oxo-dGTP pyrophosphatase MutT (NUDIX family)